MRLIYVFFLFAISSSVCGQNLVKTDQIFTIDKDKSYSKKSLAEWEQETFYIPLETSKDILLDVGAHIYYVSDKKILITNWKRGDVYIFDWNGKIVSRFNQKGGTGYLFINYAVYDEPKKEVYILDKNKKKVFVYTETGVLKRTLKCPENTYLTKIYNFDEESLLVYHQHRYETLTQKQPYMLISKADGQIISKLNFFIDKVNPTSIATDNALFGIKVSAGNCKFGDEYFLSSISSDTISVLKQDKSLFRLFVQSPSVFADSRLVTKIGLKTDDFIVMNIYPFDVKKSYRDQLNGKKQPGYVNETNLIFDLKKKQFYECSDYYVDDVYDVDIAKNMSAKLINAYKLKRFLENGDLKGEIKKIAEKIDVTDNPVVKITKFK